MRPDLQSGLRIEKPGPRFYEGQGHHREMRTYADFTVHLCFTAAGAIIREQVSGLLEPGKGCSRGELPTTNPFLKLGFYDLISEPGTSHHHHQWLFMFSAFTRTGVRIDA